MKKRSRFTVVTKLIGLVKPLTAYMALAVIMGLSDICALLLSRFSEGLPYSILSVLMCRLV